MLNPIASFTASYSHLMSDEMPTPQPKLCIATWIGLFISLFGMLMVRPLLGMFTSGSGLTSAVMREGGMWLIAAALLLIVTRFERLPLRSIGLGTRRWTTSILWGCVLVLLCLPVALVLMHLTGNRSDEAASALDKLPVWLLTLVVVRAGFLEELCYRGFAIERLQAVGLPRWIAGAVPLVIFGLAHYRGGWAGVVMALGLGAVLTAVYLWRRDLVANMIGHFLVDFLGNVVPKIFS
jgi:membrane protease YdiL (CAAX protease family)